LTPIYAAKYQEPFQPSKRLHFITGLLGLTERVSVSSAGDQGNGDSYCPSIDADGRFVAFYSEASNLVPGDTNGKPDFFVHDRETGLTERVSVSSTGEQANGWPGSTTASISADGRYVAFSSWATNLVPGDTNGQMDVFLRDRLAGTTERVSVSSSGAQGNNESGGAAVSADGRFVEFGSYASNLAPGDANGKRDIFVRDRLTGLTERVSVSSFGDEGDDDSQYPTGISADGRFAVFDSLASNLVPGDTNGHVDVFVHDRCGALLSAPGTRGVPGGLVAAPITLEQAEGVAGAQFDLVYDPAILTNAATQKGALIAGDPNWLLYYNVIAPGRIRVLAYNTQSEPLGPGGGTIAECTFTVSPSATRGQTSPLDIQNPVLSDRYGNPVPVVGVDGVFSVIGVHHFQFNPIPSPQHGDATTPLPFTVTVWAKDENGNLASHYNDSAILTDLTATLDLDPGTSGITEATAPFIGGIYTGSAVIRQPIQVDRITAVDALDPSATGVSNDFAVIGEADPTGDGETNIQDVVQTVNVALETAPATPAELAAADVNEDGRVDVRDVIIIQNIILGPHGGGAEMLPLHGKASARGIGPVVAMGKPPAPGAKKIGVPVLIDSAQGVAGFNFDLAYDSKALSPVEVRAGALISGKPDWLVNGNLAKNPLRVLAFSSQSLALSGKGGTLVEVVFAETGKGGADSVRLSGTVVSDSAGNSLPRTITLGKPRAVK
jgi:hypothetical protein